MNAPTPTLPVFMDNHSTTRVDPRVMDAMQPYFTEKYGNAASVNHSFGWEAADAVEVARAQVARLLSVSPKQVIFTSGATEANNLALKGVMHAAARAQPKPAADGDRAQLITTAAEHRSVLDPAKRLGREGHRVSIVPVDEHGRVGGRQIADEITPSTQLVSVILANNEVGSINPVAEIAAACRERGVLFHTDAVQAAGKIPLLLDRWGIDLASITAHKLYGPKGVGAIVVRRGAKKFRLDPQLDGGGHERGIRSGTLPVPLIVGFGKACELALELMDEESRRIAALRDRLWQGLAAEIDGILLNGHPGERLSGNLNVSIEAVDGEALMTSLNQIAVSTGSACTSADPEPSHVLRAMGRSDALTRASLRFGLGRFNTPDEVEFAIGYVAAAVRRLRKLSARRR